MIQAHDSASWREGSGLLTVVSFSFVLGMAVAIGTYWLWQSQFITVALNQPGFIAAIVVCPAFILSVAAGGAMESSVGMVLLVGTMVFANGFLYAGVAAGVYSIATVVWKRK